MRQVILIISVLIIPIHAITQNLVRNGDFEDYVKCPKEASAVGLGYLKYWFQPTIGTTDYYNECGKKGPAGVPANIAGFSYAKTGKGYVGMVFYNNEPLYKGDYREYISTKLLSALVKGKQYIVKLYVKLAQSSEYAVSNIQIFFSMDSISSKTQDRLKKCIPQLAYEKGPITDTTNWSEISWTYVAKGDETFMTIGNFTKKKECTVEDVQAHAVRGRTKGPNAYYYIDDVSITELENHQSDSTKSIIKDTSKRDTVKTQGTLLIRKNENIVLTNVFFENGQSKLLPDSYNELDKLIVYLQTNPAYKIFLSGYTDNIGEETRNIELSEARAKAVADYLISGGINNSRVGYKGCGSENPINNNNTEKDRAKNRRVEFKISDK